MWSLSGTAWDEHGVKAPEYLWSRACWAGMSEAELHARLHGTARDQRSTVVDYSRTRAIGKYTCRRLGDASSRYPSLGPRRRQRCCHMNDMPADICLDRYRDPCILRTEGAGARGIMFRGAWTQGGIGRKRREASSLNPEALSRVAVLGDDRCPEPSQGGDYQHDPQLIETPACQGKP